MDLSAMYDNDKNFKEYIDRYCKCRQISKEEALSHTTTKEVAEMYSKYPKDCESKGAVQTINTCGC